LGTLSVSPTWPCTWLSSAIVPVCR
jgi:hypothetical protein